MDITQDFAEATYVITAYQPGCVFINDEPHTENLIISPEQVIIPWNTNSISDLSEESCEALISMQPEIVILGSGAKLQMPNPRILELFSRQHIGLETMNTHSACRTYGILIAESRKAVAGLILNND